MINDVWKGKKVQIISLEELEKNHFFDEERGIYFYSEEYAVSFPIKQDLLRGIISREIVKKHQNKIVSVNDEYLYPYISLSLKEIEDIPIWCLKELVTIEDILNTD